MTSRLTQIIAGSIGLAVFAIFIIGLSHSISTGFAGFKGGLPFAIIAGFVLCLAAYDFYDECVRGNPTDSRNNKNE